MLLWLADHYADNAIRLDAAKPEDVEVIVAAQRWLASLPAASALPMPAAMRATLPMVA